MDSLPTELLQQICLDIQSTDVSSSDWRALSLVSSMSKPNSCDQLADVTAERFHSITLPFLYHTINEKQLRSTSLSDALTRRPAYTALVRSATWQLLARPKGRQSGDGTDDQLGHQIQQLSRFSASECLSIIAGEESDVGTGETEYKLDLVPTNEQLAELKMERLYSLSFCSPAVTFRMCSKIWTMLHCLASNTTSLSLVFSSGILFEDLPRQLEWASVRSLDIQDPASDGDSDLEIRDFLDNCPTIQCFDFSYGNNPCGLEAFFGSCLENSTWRLLVRHIRLSEAHIEDYDADRMDVASIASSLPQLQTLELNFITRKLPFQPVRLSAMQDHLSALFPPSQANDSLTSMIITCDSAFDLLLRSGGFKIEALASLLNRDIFPKLQRFIFRCQKSEEYYWVEDGPPEEDGQPVERYRVDDEYKNDLRKLVNVVPSNLVVTLGYIAGAAGRVESFSGSSETGMEVNYWRSG